MSENNPHHEDLILQRYRKLKFIKKTNRKEIWLVESINSGEKCILKSQPHSMVQNSSQRTVLHEANFLHAMQGHVGFPFMIWSGQEHETYLILVEELGLPLNYIFEKICKKSFSIKTVCMIGLQILKIIQDYHSVGFVHRRLLPQSFQLGKTHKNHLIFINDLFDSKKYTSQRTNKHLQAKKNSKLSSHLSAFTTLNQIQQGQSSRRDDIESIILLLIYFIRGDLPWQSIAQKKMDNDQKMETLRIAISKTSIKHLCYGMPKQFGIMLEKARSMSFIQEPNYHWFIQQLERIMFRNNYENDCYFDWVRVNSQQKMIHLKVQKMIPTIHLPNEDAILQQYFYPYQGEVEIDVVTQKSKKKLEKQDKNSNPFMVEQSSDQKGSKHNKDQKKNKKNDCQIM